MFIAKYLIIFFLTPLAFPETNISSICLNKAQNEMDQKTAMQFCHNVANDCFMDFEKDYGLYESQSFCLNTANHCYQDVKKQSRDIVYARNKCLDVQAPCFSYYRRNKLSIEDAIIKCRY